jgi:hypothetical protein
MPLAVGYRLWTIAYWLLPLTGYWLLAIGYWRFSLKSSQHHPSRGPQRGQVAL